MDLRKILLFIPAILFFPELPAQVSSKTLSEQQVTGLVKRFHPVAKQAIINIEKAKADVTIARGLFDPVATSNVSSKTFDGTAYYNSRETGLVIPTWYGIELSAGIENLQGNRTDPQETLGRTSFAGISVPLARNLLMDKRRAALKQSKIFREMSEVEQQSILNDLLLDALQTYWRWVQQYQVMEVVRNAVAVNEKRLELVRIAFRQGDRPAIDTTEALAQLQSFRYALNEAELNFRNAGLDLSVFLWKENNEPYNLPAAVIPDNEWKQITIPAQTVPLPEELLQLARKNHPDLLQYNYQLDALAIERKLKFQEFLPTVNFRYNQLGRGYDIVKTATNPILENNYQYGITIGIPLRLSQGRGEYRKAKLQIQETELSRNQKTVEVENKVKALHNELQTLQQQVMLQQEQYRNYLALQRGEETRFFNGESSLFLVNSRENKTLEALEKLAELETKYFATLKKLQWAAGILHAQ